MQQIKSFVDTKIIYLYDLPPKEYTSTKLAKYIYAQTGYHLEVMPQVTRDLTKPFYSARIKIENSEKFELVMNALRYFTFEGHPCRGLPYQNDLLGVNIQKLAEHNLFVRKLPKSIYSDGLEQQFTRHGKIISCKVSIDENYNSKGYGFITFQNAKSAQDAFESSQGSDSIIGVKYAPRGKTEFRKVFNNIFVKDFPNEWQEQELRDAFSVFGNITSIKLESNNIGKYAFICFGSTDPQNRDYGSIAASSAVHEMNKKEINGKQMYCCAALKKQDRVKEIEQESLKYKNSKRRLNLFVKGFGPEIQEEELRSFFEVHGQIESLKIIRTQNQKPYAFVCYFTPDAASKAKSAQIQINGGQPLTIKLYELKEQRDIIKEAQEDLKGWNQYQAELAPQTQFQNIEQITSVLQMLMASVSKQGPNNQGMQGFQQNRHNNHQQNNQGQYRNNNYQGNQNRQNQVGQNNYGNRNQHHSQQRPAPMPQVQQVPIPTPMPMAPQGFSQQVQFVPSQDPMAQELYSKTLPIYAAITEINPSYKQVVGSTIFEFVTRLAGQQYAPKITGMLIDLPIPEIQRYATNFDLFAQRIQQALQLLSQQSIAQ